MYLYIEKIIFVTNQEASGRRDQISGLLRYKKVSTESGEKKG
jgi:hypothetical protein